MTWTYSLHVEVDWWGLGWETAADLQDDLVSATCTRGFSGNAKDGFVALVGEATIQLLNAAGQYSRHNASGPYFGQLRGGKPIRLRVTTATEDEVIWVGRTYKISPAAPLGDQPVAALTAKGQFIRLADERKVNPGSSTGDTTDILLAAVFEAVGFGGGERDFDTGEVTTGIWQPGDVQPFDEARLIVATELGRLYERKDGVAAFERRHYRRDETRSNTVQLIWSDDPADAETAFGYRDVELSDPEDQIYDRIKIDFTPVFTLSDEPELITEWLGSLFGLTVPAGSSRTFTLDAFWDRGSNNPYFMAEWVLPTINAGNGTSTLEVFVGGGYALASDLTLSNISTTDRKITFTLTNADPDNPARISYALQWGRVGLATAPVHQIVGDGTREYPLPGPYYPSAGPASQAARWLFNYYSQGRDLLVMETTALQSEDLFTALLAAEISDRWHVKATGLTTEFALDEDFFLERESWTFDRDREVSYQALLSACLPNTHDTEDEETSLPTGAGLYYAMEQSSGLVRDSLATLYHLTRHGTTATVGMVGRGQGLFSIQGDALLNADSGLPDTHLTDSWEWDGWINPDAPSGVDEIILQKDIGASPAYRVFEYALDPTHRYFMASITTEDGTFTTVSDGNLIATGAWYFLRLVHDAVAKTLGWSVNLGPLNLVTYTGTPVSTSDGIVFGGSGDFTIESMLDYWFRARDLDGGLVDGDPMTDWPDASGNNRDTTGSAGTITFETAEAPDGGSVVRFNTGRFGIPEIALADTQIWVYAKVIATGFQGTLFRTSSTVGPNYAVGINNAGGGNYYLWAHFYTDNNNGGVKVRVTTPITLPYGYHSIRVTDDGTGATLAIAVDGAVQTIEPDTQSITGASGINPDQTTQADIKEIIVAHDLTSGQIADVEAYLPVGGSLAGSGTNSLGGVLDEWLYMPERILTDAEAEARYNSGMGSTATGGSIISTNPTTPPVVPGSVPSGTIGDRPLAAAPNSLYFATDEDGGTLYLMIGTTWTQVANGLTEAILKSIVDAKGDLIAGTAADTVARLAVGADGEFLRAASGEATGLEYYDHEGASDPHPQYTTAAELAAAIGAIPSGGQYRALVLTSPDGIGVEIVDDGAGHAVTILQDLE